MAWAAFDHKQLQSQESNGQEEEPTRRMKKITNGAIQRPLLPQDRLGQWPPDSDKRVDALIENLTITIKQAPMTRRKTNMTHREVTGLKWCREKIRSRTLYINRADKGGSVYIFDAAMVISIIENTLSDESKYSQLQDDLRKLIRSDLNALLDSCIDIPHHGQNRERRAVSDTQRPFHLNSLLSCRLVSAVAKSQRTPLPCQPISIRI
jgi:hypothetical protein